MKISKELRDEYKFAAAFLMLDYEMGLVNSTNERGFLQKNLFFIPFLGPSKILNNHVEHCMDKGSKKTYTSFSL